jgi:hypothetical protein
VELKEDSTVHVNRTTVRTTAIGGRPYASAKSDEGEAWYVLRYDMPDDSTVRVLAMDERTVAADVRAEGVAGKVEESKGPSDGEPTLTVTLTPATALLRAYLELRGDDVYRKDRVLVLRRVRLS